MSKTKKKGLWLLIVALLTTVSLVVSTLTIGCQGPAGTTGPAGTSTGTISGKVTNKLAGSPLGGVAVTTEPAIKDVTIVTSDSGDYSATLPIGNYSLTFKKDKFTSATQAVSLVAGETVTKDVALVPAKAVVVDAGKDQNVSPGASVTLKAATEPFDGSTATSYKWTQTAGIAAKIDNPNSDTITVTLDKADAYKAALLAGLKQLERFTVQAINPHALEAAETATFKVTVTTSSGTYSDTVNVVAGLPYVINGGIANVPVGLSVLLHGKTQVSYSWTLTAPSGSTATLDDASDQNPSFTPDIPGKYAVSEKTSKATFDVYAGTWAGAISGVDAKGLPLSAGCTICHDGKNAPDNFTAWKASGHAEIFTQNINNPAGHWSMSCASCHTVGYAPDATNKGFDEAAAAEGWTVPSHGEVGYYAEMLKKYPKTAGLANIQCESCHGPNNSALHMNKTIDAERVSLSSDACGACHGEPLRHGRYQQWEESGHSGIESTTTPERATSSSCARCHSAQGFLLWLKQGDLTKSLQGANGNATAAEMTALGFTADKLEPVTCVACHDPHAQGTTSGEPNTATVRITGDTAKLPAGFKAKEVGKGALCMTCHNTRNAAHNDANPPTSYSAPHTAAQADVLMGENAYFVAESQRSPHSYIKDTCVTCHMEESPPPAEFSYNLSGTNHSFGASTAICSSCHSSTLDAKALEMGVEDKLHKLAQKMSSYLLNKMPARVFIQDYTPHSFGGKEYDVKSDAIAVDKDNIASIEPTEPHGQQGFIIKFKSPITVTYRPTGEAAHTVVISEAEVQLGNFTTDGTVVLITASDALVKAGWNYFLVEGDGSEGIHNPAFVHAMLDATIAALK